MRSIILLLGILLLLLTGQTANACSCAGPRSPCESFGSAKAVFAGTAIAVRDNERSKDTDRSQVDWTPRVFKFLVEQSFLGVSGTEVEVHTGTGGGDCGYGFKIGERYLVYAFGDGHRLATGICTRTKPFNSATEDLAFLGTLSSARPGVTIQGVITRSDGGKIEDFGPDVFVTIEGESQRKEIRPDADGRFRLSGLPAGTYKAKLHLPESLTTYREENEISVADRGCATLWWAIAINGRVEGKVVDAQGVPIAKIMVGLVKPGTNPRDNHVALVRTDDQGNFKFAGISAGRYLIAVNHTRFPEPNDPTRAYPPSFYPGVPDEVNAETISLATGEKVSDLLIRMPFKRPASVLKISVVWSDGSPVGKAILTVKDITQDKSTLGFSFEADAGGQYVLEGYVGQRLIISAYVNRPYDPNARSAPAERSEEVRMTLQQPAQSARIVIAKTR